MQTLPWVLATYVPIEVAYMFVVWKVIGSLSRSAVAEIRWLAFVAFAAAAVLTSALGVLAGQLWAILLEIVRVGDGHLGYRTQFIPYMQIELRMFVFGVAAFLAAVLVYRYSAQGHRAVALPALGAPSE